MKYNQAVLNVPTPAPRRDCTPQPRLLENQSRLLGLSHNCRHKLESCRVRFFGDPSLLSQNMLAKDLERLLYFMQAKLASFTLLEDAGMDLVDELVIRFDRLLPTQINPDHTEDYAYRELEAAFLCADSLRDEVVRQVREAAHV